MLQAELIAPRHFRLVEAAPTDPAPGEIQVRVHAVGICGSDLHSYREGAIGDTPCIYPMVLGHEPAGAVVKTGPGVTGWSPGDRAALEPAVYCYHCEACRTGHHNVCENIRFLSNPGIPGFFREFVNLPAANLVAIPPDLSYDMGTLVEPLAIALHSMKFAAIQPGEAVAVFGAGPIGLLTIACLKVAKAGRIYAIEPVAARRALALLMGADAALDPADPDAARLQVPCAIDCAAASGSTNHAIRSVQWAGRVVLTGIHTEALVPFEVSPMRRKELTIYNVRRSNHESEAALAMLLHNESGFAPILTHRRPLADIAEGFRLTEQYADGVGKMIIVP